MRDENDQLQAGTLPADPLVGAAPMEGTPEAEVARAAAELSEQRVGTWLADAWERLLARGRGEERPIPTPWPVVDQALSGGIWPGLHVLVGGTGTGKSQWALQLALHAALQGTPVLYIGLELGRVDLAARLLGLISHRRWSRLYLGRDGQGRTTTDELDQVADRHTADIERLEKAPIYLEVCPPMGWSYTELHRKALALRELHPELAGRRGSKPMLLVLDFLQLVGSPEGGNEDLRERIGRAAYAGRAVARDLDAAVLLLSSTSRANYGALTVNDAGKREPAAALVGLGKESGEVEYAADSVLVFVRRKTEGPRKVWSQVDVAVAKARAPSEALLAADGWLELEFNGGRFREPGGEGDVDDPDEDPPSSAPPYDSRGFR